MPLPLNLFLVRHGYSEVNAARDVYSTMPEEFKARHDSVVRLTQEGEFQAALSGEWLRAELKRIGKSEFDGYYVSPHLRTRETAYHLALNGQWRIDDNWRERDWGLIGHLSVEEAEKIFSSEMMMKTQSEWYWNPPLGESMAGGVASRARAALETLSLRHGADSSIVAVSHGEFIATMKFVLEDMTPAEWEEEEKNKTRKTHNAVVVHYTRQNPFTGEVTRDFSYKRGIVPWDLSKSWDGGEWIEIKHQTYSDSELIPTVNDFPRLMHFDNEKP